MTTLFRMEIVSVSETRSSKSRRANPSRWTNSFATPYLQFIHSGERGVQGAFNLILQVEAVYLDPAVVRRSNGLVEAGHGIGAVKEEHGVLGREVQLAFPDVNDHSGLRFVSGRWAGNFLTE